jgi:hypothetical protein
MLLLVSAVRIEGPTSGLPIALADCGAISLIRSLGAQKEAGADWVSVIKS